MKILSPLLLATFLTSCSGTPDETKSGKNDSVADSTTLTENNALLSITNQDSLDSTSIEFGFCDLDGRKALLLADSLADPGQFSAVVDSDHNIAWSMYLKKQKEDNEDNGRQNEYNFSHCKGYLYTIKNKTAAVGSSVVFMTAGFVSQRKIFVMNPPAKKELPVRIQSRIEKEKGRKIKDYRCLTIPGKDSSIYIFEFENKSDSALASLAFITPGKIVYQDFPAAYNDVSTWRVDDGGNFGVEYFNLLAVFSKDGKLEIVTDWPGAEGFVTEYLKEKDGVFKSVKGQSRYTAPI
jgi:hypothetical protein